jgi:DNA gyrase subunit A
MQLRRLTALEANKIEQEHEELLEKITDLKDILAKRERILEIVETEAKEIQNLHGDPRRTEIELAEGEFDETDLIANERAIVMVTEQGYIKRMPVNTFEAQSRATRGKAGTKMKEDDAIEHFIACCDHDSVLFFTQRGVVYSLNAYQIPMGSRTARGVPIVQMLPIPRDEKVTSIVTVSEFSDDEYLVMLTKGGCIKKTNLSAFANIRSNGLRAISLSEGDQLRWVRRARIDDSVIIGSALGMGIHFRTDNKQLRPLGRNTRGVKAMKLSKGDELISMDILPSSIVDAIADIDEDEELEVELEEEELEEYEDEYDEDEGEEEEEDDRDWGPWVLVITNRGYGKRVPVSQFTLQNRAGKGRIAIKFKKKNRGVADRMAALRIVNEEDELMIITARGIIIRQAVDAISIQSRSATGVRVQKLDTDDAIAEVALVPLAGEEDMEEMEDEELEEEEMDEEDIDDEEEEMEDEEDIEDEEEDDEEEDDEEEDDDEEE